MEVWLWAEPANGPMGVAEASVTHKGIPGGNSLKTISGLENRVTTPDPIHDFNGSIEGGT